MKYSRWLTSLLLLTALTACQLPSGSRDAPERFQLTLSDPASPTEQVVWDGEHGILFVDRPHPAPGYGTARIAYQTAPHQLRYYRDSRWADTPDRMLEAALIAALEGSGLFRAVVGRPSTLSPDYYLATDLLHLVQRFDSDAQTSVTLLRLRVRLLDLDRERIVGTKTVDVRVPAPSADAAGGVAAANRALEQAVDQVRQFLASALTNGNAEPAAPAVFRYHSGS